MLAIWVVVSHVMMLSGVTLPVPACVGRILAGGAYAVDIFVIVSGFVIFLLLDRHRPRYRDFVGQRFFRLAPMFAVGCAFGWIVRPLEQINLQHWHLVLRPDVVQRQFEFHRALDDGFIAHFMAHATLLHGLVPDALLQHASLAFLPPGWSVSLEWQFYLVAPLAWLAFERRRFVWLGLAGLVAGLSNLWWGEIGPGSALVNHFEFFMIGMSSYLLYREVERQAEVLRPAILEASPWVYLTLSALVAQLLDHPALVPFVLWIGFFWLALLRRVAPTSKLSSAASAIFTHPWLRRLGTHSYCLYLLHQPVLYALQAVAFTHLEIREPMQLFVWTCLGTLPITIALSWIAHHLVERPGMRLGRRLFAEARRASPR